MDQQRATEILDKWTSPKLNMTKDEQVHEIIGFLQLQNEMINDMLEMSSRMNERTIERHKDKYESNLAFIGMLNDILKCQ